MSRNKMPTWLATILGLVIITALIIAVIFIVKYVFSFLAQSIEWLATLSEKLDAVIIVALITAAVSVLSMIFAKIIENRQITKRYLYSKREEPYTRFTEIVYKMRDISKKENEYTQEKIIADIVEVSQGLTLWGSNRVVKKWLKFRTSSTESNIDPSRNLILIEDILFEIRRDMGHKKGTMKQGDLLKFFVNDIDETLKKRHSSK